MTKTMMRAFVCAATLPAAAGLAQAIWNNQAGTNNWFTPGNWNTQQVPISTTDVTVPAGFGTVSVVGGFDVRSISALSPLYLSGGVAGHWIQPSSIKDSSIYGGLVSDALMTFTGTTLAQPAYSWRGSGGFKNTGTFTSIAVQLGDTTFLNTGTLKIAGMLGVGNQASLESQGTLELLTNGNLNSSGYVRSSGTFKKTGNGTSAIQNPTQIQGGSFEVQAGTVEASGGISFESGSVTVAGGAQLKLSWPTTIPHTFWGPTFSGGGDVEMQVNGNFQSPGAVIMADQAFNLTGASGLYLYSGNTRVQQTAVLRNQAKSTWHLMTVLGPGEFRNEPGATIATLNSGSNPTLSDNLVLTNSGLIDFGSQVTFIGSTLENLPSGTVHVSAWMFYSPGVPYGTVVNRGTFRKTGLPPDLCEVRPRFDQRDGGTTLVEGGTLQLEGGGTLGPGGSSFDLGALGGGVSPILRFGPGTYTVTDAGHQIRSVSDGSRLEITGSTTMDVQSAGTLTLNVSPHSAGGAYLLGPASLGGAGKVINQRFLSWAGMIGVNNQATFHNDGPAANVKIPQLVTAQLRGTINNVNTALFEQYGTINMPGSTINNDARWSTDPEFSNIWIQGAGGTFHNAGNFVVSGYNTNQTLTISTRLNNTGAILVDAATLSLTGVVDQVQNGTLTGGMWTVLPSGRLIFPAGAFTRIAGATIRGGETGFPMLGNVNEIDGAELRATDDISVNGALTIKGGGQLFVGPGADVTIPGGTSVGTPTNALGYANTQTVVTLVPDPPRIITPTMTVYGTIRGGGPDAPGPFNLVGNLAMQGTGTVEMELGGLIAEDEYDRVNVSGSASLSGTLNVKLLPGFVPQLGQTFTVLACSGTRTGTFASITEPAGLPAGVDLSVVYGPNSATLQVVTGCYANCDHSVVAPVLNVLDFSCFLNRFASGDPSANCDQSTVAPVLNILDFSCFLNRFGAGCS